jgi:surface polysaccharide O-acyltransferase-like enzyme
MHINTRRLASSLSLLVFYTIDVLVHTVSYGVAGYFLYEKHQQSQADHHAAMPTISSSGTTQRARARAVMHKVLRQARVKST